MLKDDILNVFNFQQCCCLHIAVTTTIISYSIIPLYIYYCFTMYTHSR